MRAHADKVTPERKYLTMETPFMEAYVQLLIHTCHSRGAFAMGGMAAQIPVKNNPKLAAAALESVKKDKVIRRKWRLFQREKTKNWRHRNALLRACQNLFFEMVSMFGGGSSNPGPENHRTNALGAQRLWCC